MENKRATPSTARRIAEAAMPMMVDLKFNIQLSRFNEEECRVKGFASRDEVCGGRG
jgi:hypothetical protein